MFLGSPVVGSRQRVPLFLEWHFGDDVFIKQADDPLSFVHQYAQDPGTYHRDTIHREGSDPVGVDSRRQSMSVPSGQSDSAPTALSTGCGKYVREGDTHHLAAIFSLDVGDGDTGSCGTGVS